jgi:hypothetical protein
LVGGWTYDAVSGGLEQAAGEDWHEPPHGVGCPHSHSSASAVLTTTDVSGTMDTHHTTTHPRPPHASPISTLHRCRGFAARTRAGSIGARSSCLQVSDRFGQETYNRCGLCSRSPLSPSPLRPNEASTPSTAGRQLLSARCDHAVPTGSLRVVPTRARQV